jgi:hypothetical protein
LPLALDVAESKKTGWSLIWYAPYRKCTESDAVLCVDCILSFEELIVNIMLK